ncbi:MAG: hypothetical protein IH595_00930 [Bacteroidales bacterium]|nr:hypothetical protein [Bacteroidales bacterium]
MRKLLNFILIAAFLVGLYSCKQHKPDTTENFNTKLQEFKKNINKVDNTITMVDSLEKQRTRINDERDAGKITDSEAKRKLDVLDSTLGRKVAKSTNLHPAKSLPDWASELGLRMPVGMELDTDYSQITSEKNDDEGFNSVVLVFKGDYNTAMKQAAIIARDAHVPLTKEYKTAFEMKEKYGEEIIKGAVYMNFELGDPIQPKYSIAITVSENGTLTISATDSKGMESHLKINNLNAPKGTDSL